jgi:hypothetical protein
MSMKSDTTCTPNLNILVAAFKHLGSSLARRSLEFDDTLNAMNERLFYMHTHSVLLLDTHNLQLVNRSFSSYMKSLTVDLFRYSFTSFFYLFSMHLMSLRFFMISYWLCPFVSPCLILIFFILA